MSFSEYVFERTLGRVINRYKRLWNKNREGLVEEASVILIFLAVCVTIGVGQFYPAIAMAGIHTILIFLGFLAVTSGVFAVRKDFQKWKDEKAEEQQ